MFFFFTWTRFIISIIDSSEFSSVETSFILSRHSSQDILSQLNKHKGINYFLPQSLIFYPYIGCKDIGDGAFELWPKHSIPLYMFYFMQFTTIDWNEVFGF